MAAILAAAAIIVEGAHDRRFMRQYLEHLGFGSLLFDGELKDPNRTDKIIIRETSESGGIGPLTKKGALLPDVKEICASSDNILIVADANANFKKRWDKLQITARKITEEQTEAKVKVFLLPDNEGAGELENLLEAISVDRTVYECLEQYEECLRKSAVTKNKLKMKGKIYAYCEARGIPVDWKCRNYLNEKHWNLNCSKLDGLREFLSQNLPRPRG